MNLPPSPLSFSHWIYYFGVVAPPSAVFEKGRKENMGKEVASDMRFFKPSEGLVFSFPKKKAKKPSLPNIFRVFQQYFFSSFGECGARQKIACKQAMLQIFLLLRLTFNSVSHTRGVPTCSSRILGTQRRESDPAKSDRTEQNRLIYMRSGGRVPETNQPPPHP